MLWGILRAALGLAAIGAFIAGMLYGASRLGRVVSEATPNRLEAHIIGADELFDQGGPKST